MFSTSITPSSNLDTISIKFCRQHGKISHFTRPPLVNGKTRSQWLMYTLEFLQDHHWLDKMSLHIYARYESCPSWWSGDYIVMLGINSLEGAPNNTIIQDLMWIFVVRNRDAVSSANRVPIPPVTSYYKAYNSDMNIVECRSQTAEHPLPCASNSKHSPRRWWIVGWKEDGLNWCRSHSKTFFTEK